MNEELLNASEAEVVQPQNDTTGASEAEITRPQEVDIDSMSDDEFMSYLENPESYGADTTQTVTADEQEQKNEPEDVGQAEENVFKTYKTQKDWQDEIDGIMGKRLKASRERDEAYEGIVGIAKDFYSSDDGEAAVKTLVEDLSKQIAERKSMSVENYTQERQVKEKARLYDRMQEQTRTEQQMQEKRQQTLAVWEAQSAELKKTVPDFDFNKALENKEFYDRVVRGYSVEDAYRLTHKEPIVQKRKPVQQSAAKAHTASKTDIDVNKLSDKDFDAWIKNCMEKEE